jgi:hypothetical protein
MEYEHSVVFGTDIKVCHTVSEYMLWQYMAGVCTVIIPTSVSFEGIEFSVFSFFLC